jgi:hypothetical protein
MTGSSEPPGMVEPPEAVEPPGMVEPPEAVGQPDGPADGDVPAEEPEPGPREPRPMIERIGLAFIALLLAVLFGVVSVASWVGGELFLAVMAGVGCVMTIWVGTLTLVRG